MQKVTATWSSLSLVVPLLLLLGRCSQGLSQDEMMTLAVHHHIRNDYDKALVYYQMLVDEYPESDLVPQALYALGVICEDKKRDVPRALAAFRRIARDYPGHTVGPGATYLVALLLKKDVKDSLAAIAAYEEFLRRYPSAPMSASARMELAELKEARKRMNLRGEN